MKPKIKPWQVQASDKLTVCQNKTQHSLKEKTQSRHLQIDRPQYLTYSKKITRYARKQENVAR